jgi:hypothetical protein
VGGLEDACCSVKSRVDHLFGEVIFTSELRSTDGY